MRRISLLAVLLSFLVVNLAEAQNDTYGFVSTVGEFKGVEQNIISYLNDQKSAYNQAPRVELAFCYCPKNQKIIYMTRVSRGTDLRESLPPILKRLATAKCGGCAEYPKVKRFWMTAAGVRHSD